MEGIIIRINSVLGDNQMNTVHLNKRLTGLHRKVRLGMHGKVEKTRVDPMNISLDNS